MDGLEIEKSLEVTGTLPTPAAEAPAKGTAEYEKWLDDTARVKLNEQESAGLILGKFKSQEDLVAAYQEAQAELTRTKQGVKAPEVKPTEATKEVTAEAPKEATPGSKVDRAKYTQEIASSGALSEASYKELEAAGYDKDMVDAYVAGQRAIAQTKQNEALAVVGGRDAFKQMSSWFAATATDAELSSYNKLVNTNDTTRLAAMELLKARYESANGRAPARLISGGNSASGAEGYQSQQEAVTAMKDPRYSKDPAYRATVERKLAALLRA